MMPSLRIDLDKVATATFWMTYDAKPAERFGEVASRSESPDEKSDRTDEYQQKTRPVLTKAQKSEASVRGLQGRPHYWVGVAVAQSASINRRNCQDHHPEEDQ
ncbi:hypothetical protein AB4144_08905 [Rhizobiaceae sp. 2RAB30]